MIELIVNPVAGNGRAKIAGDQAAAHLRKKGVDFTMRLTNHPGHATELAKDAAARGITTVIALGGDGTVTETAQGLKNSHTALGIAPAGTGNDFVKAIATPSKLIDALDFILEHPPRPVNTGTVNDRFFMNVCGAGIDVMVLEYAETAKKHASGIWPYLYGVARAIKNFKPFKMHIEVNENTVLEGDFMICSIANGRFIGGGIPIAPHANVTDGVFDILAVDAVPRWKIPYYFMMLMTGNLHKHKIAHCYRSDKCALVSPGMRLNLDGEILPLDDTRFSCQTDALLLHW